MTAAVPHASGAVLTELAREMGLARNANETDAALRVRLLTTLSQAVTI